MRISEKGIDLIKYYEGLHDGDLSTIGLQPKMCPAGIWTQGYGHAIIYKGQFLKGKEYKSIAFKLFTLKDEAEAESMLREDLIKYENIVNSKIKVTLNQNEFDALVSRTFNTGGSNGLFALINTNRQCRIWWITKYITADGKILQGLMNRRKAEYELFETPII